MTRHTQDGLSAHKDEPLISALLPKTRQQPLGHCTPNKPRTPRPGGPGRRGFSNPPPPPYFPSTPTAPLRAPAPTALGCAPRPAASRQRRQIPLSWSVKPAHDRHLRWLPERAPPDGLGAPCPCGALARLDEATSPSGTRARTTPAIAPASATCSPTFSVMNARAVSADQGKSSLSRPALTLVHAAPTRRPRRPPSLLRLGPLGRGQFAPGQTSTHDPGHSPGVYSTWSEINLSIPPRLRPLGWCRRE